MILDQPFEEEVAPTPIKNKWTWFERILIAIVLGVAIIREIFSALWAYNALMILAILLALSYLLAYYWIDKPFKRTSRTILFSILYGLSFSLATFAFIFLILFIIGAKQMIYITVIVLGATFGIDVLTGRRNVRVASKTTFIRAAVFAVVLGLLYFIPESAHIQFIYRKYPGFVAYYKEHKSEGEFIRILYDYKQINKIPEGELR